MLLSFTPTIQGSYNFGKEKLVDPVLFSSFFHSYLLHDNDRHHASDKSSRNTNHKCSFNWVYMHDSSFLCHCLVTVAQDESPNKTRENSQARRRKVKIWTKKGRKRGKKSHSPLEFGPLLLESDVFSFYKVLASE